MTPLLIIRQTPAPMTPSSSPLPTATLSIWAPPLSAPWASQNPYSRLSRPCYPRIMWTGDRRAPASSADDKAALSAALAEKHDH